MDILKAYLANTIWLISILQSYSQLGKTKEQEKMEQRKESIGFCGTLCCGKVLDIDRGI